MAHETRARAERRGVAQHRAHLRTAETQKLLRCGVCGRDGGVLLRAGESAGRSRGGRRGLAVDRVADLGGADPDHLPGAGAHLEPGALAAVRARRHLQDGRHGRVHLFLAAGAEPFRVQPLDDAAVDGAHRLGAAAETHRGRAHQQGAQHILVLPAVLHAAVRAERAVGAHPPALPPRPGGEDPGALAARGRDAHREDDPELVRTGKHAVAPRPGADHDGGVFGDHVLRHGARDFARVRHILLPVLPLLEAQPVLPLHAAVRLRPDALALVSKAHVRLPGGVADHPSARPAHAGGRGVHGRPERALDAPRAVPSAHPQRAGVRAHQADAARVPEGARAQARHLRARARRGRGGGHRAERKVRRARWTLRRARRRGGRGEIHQAGLAFARRVRRREKKSGRNRQRCSERRK
mmetsp:Transcript_1841/g.7641  ORF Transcript_1841/g.7641 Transcript_1841/m.7641 type:complete len:410 (-) Transcript_1841:512-1741(-)